MTSSPGIFDQNVVARPCRAGCRAHVHINPQGEDTTDLGGNKPVGWTVQSKPWAHREESLLWFQCNQCGALVNELEVEEHRCG